MFSAQDFNLAFTAKDISPLKKIIARMEWAIKDEDRIEEILALWNVHCYSSSDAAKYLEKCFSEKVNYHHIISFLSEEKTRCDFIQDWRLAALRYGEGVNARWKREILELDARCRFIGRAKEIHHDLNPVTRDALLESELAKVKGVIANATLSMKFIMARPHVESYTHFDIWQKLHEKAINVFRWNYPFIDNLGKVMTASLGNYAINMKRDYFTKAKYMGTLLDDDDGEYEDRLDRTDDYSHVWKINSLKHKHYAYAEPVKSCLEDVLGDLSDKTLERLHNIFKEKGKEAFCKELARHTDASTARIMRMIDTRTARVDYTR